MRKGLTLKNIKRIDKSNMLDLLLDFPMQCRYALRIAKDAKILFKERDLTKIVFLGMGGSAIGGDLVKSYLYSESKLPIAVFREYEVPEYLDSSTLVFILSYSGNTEETLNAYASAKKKSSNLVIISSGGILEEYAQKDKITFIQIPKGLPPRCALGYLSIIPLCILAKLGLIKEVNPNVFQMISVLEDLKNRNLNPHIGKKDNIAKYVADKLFNRFIIIYSSSVHFEVVAARLRTQLNENSKALASSHVFPEMNHNEIVGWQNPKKLFKSFVVICFRDKDMHPQVLRRMDITRDIIKNEGASLIEVWSSGEDLLSRVFSLIYIGDFISYYLAILYGIDPTPVDRVTYLKNELAESV